MRANTTSLATLCLLLSTGALASMDLPLYETSARAAVDKTAAMGLNEGFDTAMGQINAKNYLSAYEKLKPGDYADGIAERMLSHYDVCKPDELCAGPLIPELTFNNYYRSIEEGKDYAPDRGGDSVTGHYAGYALLSGYGYAGEFLDFGYGIGSVLGEETAQIKARRAYGKMNLGKWSLKYGRDNEYLGHGRHGSLLMSADMPAFDHWRLRTEELLRLPGFLDSLGGFGFMLLNGRLDDDNPSAPDRRFKIFANTKSVPNPYLMAMRLSYYPAQWLGLGINRAVMYGGDGRARYDTFSEYADLLTAKNENVKDVKGDKSHDNDQMISLDMVMHLPILADFTPLKGGSLYFEYGGTDLFATWQGDNTGSDFPVRLDDIGILSGLYLVGQKTDFRAEWAKVNNLWYKHHIYGQGYSYRQAPIGHHMGSDSYDLFAEIGRQISPSSRAYFSLDYERRGRSYQVNEKRLEPSIGLEERLIKTGALTLRGKLDLSAAKVWDALDSADRADRYETSATLSFSSGF